MLARPADRRIAGAAFDVYHHEPLTLDDPLMKMENVVKLPHIGGATRRGPAPLGIGQQVLTLWRGV